MVKQDETKYSTKKLDAKKKNHDSGDKQNTRPFWS